jgi:hypothetical protein
MTSRPDGASFPAMPFASASTSLSQQSAPWQRRTLAGAAIDQWSLLITCPNSSNFFPSNFCNCTACSGA